MVDSTKHVARLDRYAGNLEYGKDVELTASQHQLRLGGLLAVQQGAEAEGRDSVSCEPLHAEVVVGRLH